MTFKEIKVSELEEFINSDFFNNSEFIPISKHRAISHANNPRAVSDDVSLILALEENEMAGYIGLLPDYFYVNDKVEKVGWLSCLWVSPKHRGKNITKNLLKRAWETYKSNVCATEFTLEAQRIYESIGEFVPLQKMKGKKVMLRVDITDILFRKQPKLRFLSRFIKILEKLINSIIDLRLTLLKKRNKIKLKIEKVKEIDPELAFFIKRKNGNELTKREAKELNWILKYPWILESSKKDKLCKKYFFTSVQNRFEYFPYKIYNENNTLEGFIILELRNNQLKVPYAYYNLEAAKSVLQIIVKEMIELRVNILTLFDKELIAHLDEHPFLITKDTYRSYLISKKFNTLKISDYKIHAGDGDCAFT